MIATCHGGWGGPDGGEKRQIRRRRLPLKTPAPEVVAALGLHGSPSCSRKVVGEVKSGEEPWDDEGRHIGDEAVRRRSLYGDELDPECPTWAVRCVGSIHGKGRLSIGSRSIQMPVAPHLAKGRGRQKSANRLPPSYPRRGRRHAHGPVFLEERNQPVNIVRLPASPISPQHLARPPIGGTQAHPPPPPPIQVRPHSD